VPMTAKLKRLQIRRRRPARSGCNGRIQRTMCACAQTDGKFSLGCQPIGHASRIAVGTLIRGRPKSLP
jgi:hypothetical protein